MMFVNFSFDNTVRYVLVSFTDLCGVIRSKLVPVTALDHLKKNGAAFAGFAAHFNLSPSDPDIILVPDFSTAIVLPWKTDVAWVTGDLYMGDALLVQSPRNVLKHCIAQAKKDGLLLKTGVEAEFFLLSEDGACASDKKDQYLKPCYDQQSLMRRFDVISEVCDAMHQLGWKPYQADHEDATGQFEINWEYTDCLETADRHAFFKFLVKSMAEKHGFKASFMPKPFSDLTGNGCHVHCSLWNESGENLFVDADTVGSLSPIGQYFIGGLLHHAPALTALTNPTINSYKRLSARNTSSGATWAPVAISYAGNNRSHLIRIPEDDRCELRLPDGSANPYLLQASVLAAGLLGVRGKLSPGPRHNSNAYESDVTVSQPLPLDLSSSIKNLVKDYELTELLNQGFVSSYASYKEREILGYMRSVSAWEFNNTIDC
ncbi:Glutamine synthetase III [Pseudomonas caricapapayae]|uniref:Glutamine synthetase III n=2 Tax=Pseudomonas caricapapayae TaxID=46678 RepID=A0A0P9KN84_9PSED|nr:Glutamine synthetase III [Pseudomonas caricapapayae]RMM07307.1 Glutamine synthetase III [Pseudomonas caricapapayae]RMV98847.1 Glutamine synthetase III [Pseudomonas caricapapayae]